MRMKKIWHLSTCSTCQRILRESGALAKGIPLQDIKTNPITPAQLDAMKALAGSYEALFSRRSLQYRARGLQDRELKEKDYRRLILEEYTFLKRPVAVIGKKIFIGNSPATVAALTAELAAMP